MSLKGRLTENNKLMGDFEFHMWIFVMGSLCGGSFAVAILLLTRVCT